MKANVCKLSVFQNPAGLGKLLGIRAFLRTGCGARPLIFAIALLLSAIQAPSQTNAPAAGKHNGPVTAIIRSGGTLLSAGKDGFLGIWDIAAGKAVERFQLSPYEISAMVKHPQRDEICIVESNGMDIYRLSVWNYALKERLFVLNSQYPAYYINYSAAGNIIIASGFNRKNISLYNSRTGAELPFEGSPEGTVYFAATGMAERNMFVYESRGRLSGAITYWDLETGEETAAFDSLPGVSSPVIFGNNRFLAGLTTEGIVVIDSTTGAAPARYQMSANALLYPGTDGFYCLNRNTGELLQFTINRTGNLAVSGRRQFTGAAGASSFAAGEPVFFGTQDGSVLASRGGSLVPMAHNERQIRITEIAVSEKTIAFLTESGELGFLSSDYRILENSGRIPLEKTGYTRLSAVTVDQFLLWQDANTRVLPMAISSREEGILLDGIQLRFPLRSVNADKDGRILFLDTAGNLFVHNADDRGRNRLFSFSSMGATNAVFIDSDRVIISRSVILGNSPFVAVNIRTGETVPVPLQAMAGLTVYHGLFNDYAAAVVQEAQSVKTAIYRLGTNYRLEMIADFQSEVTSLSMAESGRSFAVSDGETAFIPNIGPLERTGGLIVKLAGNGVSFISLDSEGTIAWHNSQTGAITASFRLFADNRYLVNVRK